jgi:hypothetical protein
MASCPRDIRSLDHQRHPVGRADANNKLNRDVRGQQQTLSDIRRRHPAYGFQYVRSLLLPWAVTSHAKAYKRSRCRTCSGMRGAIAAYHDRARVEPAPQQPEC